MPDVPSRGMPPYKQCLYAIHTAQGTGCCYTSQADGQLTKPDPSLGVLPLWCGRLLPEDPLVHRLPPLVEAASVFGVQHERKVQSITMPRPLLSARFDQVPNCVK
jgi:hypothetical protein